MRKKTGRWLAARIDSVKAGLIRCDRLIRKEINGAVPPGSRHRLCIFSHYDPDCLIDDYVVYYVRRLCELGAEVVFVSACNALFSSEVEKIRGHCSRILLRQNVGRDFGSWKVGLRRVPEISAYGQLILANDSVYGPLYDLSKVFASMDSGDAHLWGITDSHETARHVQSYFLVFGRPLLHGPVFDRFWGSYRFHSDKQTIIDKYEIGLSTTAARAGYRLGAFCDYESIERDVRSGVNSPYAGMIRQGIKVNPTHFLWKHLITRCSCPFLKIELVRDNPSRIVDVDQWADVLSSSTAYPCELIRRHLARARRRLAG